VVCDLRVVCGRKLILATESRYSYSLVVWCCILIRGERRAGDLPDTWFSSAALVSHSFAVFGGRLTYPGIDQWADVSFEVVIQQVAELAPDLLGDVVDVL